VAILRVWLSSDTATAPGLRTVPASIAHDCSRPVDAAINAWLAHLPAGVTARFDRNACYGYDGTLLIDDGSGITVDGQGSTFKALTPGTTNRASWRIRGGHDVHLRNMIIRGIGRIVPRGKQGNGQSTQHGISFEGVVGASLTNSEIYDVRGDFVEVQPDIRKGQDYSKLPPARNITVDRVRMERADRQGLGLTNIDGFLIQNSRISDVSQVSIDIEIDVVGEVTRNIRILDNRFGPVYFAVLSNVPGSAPDAGDVTFSGNIMEAPPDTCYPAVNVGDTGLPKQGYTITSNTLRTISDAIRLTDVHGGSITGNKIIYEGNGACDNVAFIPPRSVAVRLTQSQVSIVDNKETGYPTRP